MQAMPAMPIFPEPLLQLSDLGQLNSFLRGEMSAVETYNQALAEVDDLPPLRSVLRQCRDSHHERVSLLRREVLRLGGSPAVSSGAWGVFARTVEAGATLLGAKAAIKALGEGEEHGMKDYERDQEKLSPALGRLVNEVLLPQQRSTNSVIQRLQNSPLLDS